MIKNNILHVIKDDKFFDDLSTKYDNILELNNTYLLIVESKEYKFEYIKKTKKVKLCSNIKELKTIFSNKIYNIVLFHSLPFIKMFHVFKYIRPNVKIIWWSWGYELYSSSYSLPAIIDIPLYKPLTEIVVNKMKGKGTFLYRLKYLIDFFCRKQIREKRIAKIISRIDYMIPVLECERQLVSNKFTNFHAKLLYHPVDCGNFSFAGLPTSNKILFGNSSSTTNNHLDIWKKINAKQIENHTFYLPVNYGSQLYKQILKDQIKSEKNEIVFMENFMEKVKYFSILKSCSYAIFGVMRQQAMGNIYYCLENGIKIFLYKQSVPYLELKDNGYLIFTIEDDLNEQELNIPLSLDESLYNYQLMCKKKRKRMQYFSSFIKEIQSENYI